MPPAQANPEVWLLIDDKPGHVTQVVGLAKKLGMVATHKNLSFNLLNHLPNPMLGPSLLSTTSDSAAALTGPWPHTVIGMGRRVVPVARWIAAQNNGATRVILLGRKVNIRAEQNEFHVSASHFNHVKVPNMIELLVPPTKVDREGLAELRKTVENPMGSLAEPRHLVLVGGPTVLHRFGADEAKQLAQSLASAMSGSLAILTSPRTPEVVVGALQQRLPDAHFYIWQRNEKHNPYLDYLAHADTITVTGESESMLAEAVATELPLTIYPLPLKPAPMKMRVLRAMRQAAEHKSLWGKICHKLFAAGWITPPRQLERMHEALVAAGQAVMFDGEINTAPPKMQSDADPGLTILLDSTTKL